MNGRDIGKFVVENIIGFRKKFTCFSQRDLIIAIESNGCFNGNHLASEIYTILEAGELKGIKIKSLCGGIKYYCSRVKKNNKQLPKIGFTKTRQLTEDYIWRFEYLLRNTSLFIAKNFSTNNKKGAAYILQKTYLQLSNFEAPDDDKENPRYNKVNKKIKLSGKKNNMSDDSAICWLCVTELLNNTVDLIMGKLSEDKLKNYKSIFDNIKHVHKLPPNFYIDKNNVDDDEDDLEY